MFLPLPLPSPQGLPHTSAQTSARPSPSWLAHCPGSAMPRRFSNKESSFSLSTFTCGGPTFSPSPSAPADGTRPSCQRPGPGVGSGPLHVCAQLPASPRPEPVALSGDLLRNKGGVPAVFLSRETAGSEAAPHTQSCSEDSPTCSSSAGPAPPTPQEPRPPFPGPQEGDTLHAVRFSSSSFCSANGRKKRWRSVASECPRVSRRDMHVPPT